MQGDVTRLTKREGLDISSPAGDSQQSLPSGRDI